MFPLGHIGITYFLATFLSIPFVWVAAMGALIPDVLDKILVVIGITCYPRYLGHTIISVSLFAAIFYLITKRKDLTLAVSFGWVMHLIEDLNSFVPLFYPFINYNFTCYSFGQSNVFSIQMEIIGLSLIILTWKFKSKILFFRKKLLNFWLKNK